jgi:hypothetical protein
MTMAIRIVAEMSAIPTPQTAEDAPCEAMTTMKCTFAVDAESLDGCYRLAEAISGGRAPTPTAQAGHFRTVVYRQVKRTADFEQSRIERLPGTTSKDAAWEKLYAALRRDRALIGGSIEEVLEPSGGAV